MVLRRFGSCDGSSDWGCAFLQNAKKCADALQNRGGLCDEIEKYGDAAVKRLRQLSRELKQVREKTMLAASRMNVQYTQLDS